MRVPCGLKSLALAVLACGLSFPAVADESIGYQRAKANICLSCHQIDKKRVGPSFLAIGERYGKVESAQDYLAVSIKSGGTGRWGPVGMPAQPQVSQEDARLIAQWILDLAKKTEPDS